MNSLYALSRRAFWRCLVFAALAGVAALSCPAGSQAAIVAGAPTSSYVNGNTLTFPHTVGLGVDRVLMVGVSIYNANKTVAALTYAGAPLTQVGLIDGGSGSNDRRMEMWMLVDPPVGTADVAITMSGGAKLVAGAVTFFGVNTLAPTGGFYSNEANSNLATINVPSATGELVFDVLSVKGNAATAGVGGGQTQLWNLYSASNGGAVVGTSSAEPGAANVTMSWNLATTEYWVIGAVSLKPAPPRPYLADAMIKLQTEPSTAYLYDGWYENPAALQVSNAAVLASVPAVYTLRFDNDGQNADAMVVSGTVSTPAFTVEYRDAGNVDRTAGVTAGGYTLPILASGANTTWTVLVTPVLNSAAGGDVFAVDITLTSGTDPVISDQVRAMTTCSSPALAMTKSVDLANALPGQDLSYTVVASSAGGLSDATGIVVVDSIPDYAGFRIGSATFVAGTTTLVSTVSYSSDGGASWGYTPGTGSCPAPAGYDYCITHIRWTLAGTMPPDRTFQLGMTVRVK
ncbi:MAG TPA: hypothetical protein VFX92_04170 [Candidatus Krumholzibacteria bacterium]|nr:hypothetical protein [Candidatus Krumholzibacteria bacterium]